MEDYEYKGFTIRIQTTKDPNYPFMAETQLGQELVKKRGYSMQEALHLTESYIDFTLSMRNINN